MIRGICLSTAALVLLAAPAFAQAEKCPAPKSPSVPNGRTATAPELIAAANDVKAFIAASDDYQACLKADLDEQTAAAAASGGKKGLDPKIKTALEARGDANQKEKERVGNLYNTAAQQYRAAHPAPKK